VTLRRPIVLEDRRPTDVVTAVIIPMDGVSRMPVRNGVAVQLWDPDRGIARPNRLIRNLSGHLVLVDEQADQDLTFRVDPTRAGYLGPLLVTFNPAHEGVSRIVALEPRPDGPLPPNATVVRGMVVRSTRPLVRPDGRAVASPEAGVTVTVELPAEVRGGRGMPATTDGRGVFVLVVGLKPIVTSEGIEPVDATLRFDKPETPSQVITVALDHGRTHVFSAPVDLDRANRPDFNP
jgi:hypothetical protein